MPPPPPLPTPTPNPTAPTPDPTLTPAWQKRKTIFDRIAAEDRARREQQLAPAKGTLVPGEKGGAVGVGVGRGSLPSVWSVYAEPGYGGRWTTQPPQIAAAPAESDESARHALVARWKVSEKPGKALDLNSVIVQSELVKESLARVLEGYPGVTTGLKRLEFGAPFECFVHRWEEVLAEREELRRRMERVGEEGGRAKDAVDHFEVLYSTLESELAATIRQKNDLLSHGVMKFSLLWTIFKPGGLIYQHTRGHDRIYQIRTAKYDAANPDKQLYRIDCQFVSYDGVNFGYKKAAFSIADFQGTKKITKLEVYPLEFCAAQDELKQKLTERGRMFEAYKGIHFVGYDGIAMASGKTAYNVQSRIIIDAAANIKHTNVRSTLEPFETLEQPEASPSHTSSEEPEDDMVFLDQADSQKPPSAPAGHLPIPPSPSILTPSQLLTASPLVRGYSLRDKTWLSFHIDSITPITFHASAFSSLVLPASQKDLILCLAESQSKTRKHFDDFIPGKGQGIIMLLAGPPGVGKTLTAESVAEAMRAPLYAVGAADLGSESPDDGRRAAPLPGCRGLTSGGSLTRGIGKLSQVESSLQDILELCAKWNAVLLLDEADVFMEKRSAADLERNKLVAIFLRLLEYFSGIMFLTTNRVEHMDAAFESRIHLTLNYAELDRASRKHVWATFLNTQARNTGENGGEGKFSEAELERLAREQLNGRQIKNVVKMGMLLAGRNEEGLGMGHLETVLRARRANERRTGGFFGGE